MRWWVSCSLRRWLARPLTRWVGPLGYREQDSFLESNLIRVGKILLHFELADSSQNRINLARVMVMIMGFSLPYFLSAATLVVVLFKALLSTELHGVLWAADKVRLQRLHICSIFGTLRIWLMGLLCKGVFDQIQYLLAPLIVHKEWVIFIRVFRADSFGLNCR